MITSTIQIHLCAVFHLLLLLILKSCNGKNSNVCSPSSCGNIHNITFPFRLNTDPKHCGDHRYNLHCESNSTVLYLYLGKYFVQSINYSNFTIRLVDAGVVAHDCSSVPLLPLTSYNFSLQDPYTDHIFNSSPSIDLSAELSSVVTFMACSSPASSPLYVDASPCAMSTDEKRYSYVDVGRIQVSDLMNNCSLELMSLLPKKDYTNKSYFDIHRDLAFGFELSWHYVYCGSCRGCYFEDKSKVQCISDYFKRVCYLNFGIRCTYLIGTSSAYQMFFRITRSTPTVLVLLLLLHCVIRTLFGSPLVLGFLIYKWRRRHLSGYHQIEEFLENQNNLMPIRCSYSEIKKMTEGFKDKLGEGGFGSEYKGKLRSDQVAAIKVLGKSKTNGQDFINEVATIGRIHHTNVVQLIGFCVEGSKRAQFMPNGSLDKYVSSKKGSTSLSWTKLHEISLGVAHGIEYLHKGCDMQILHFDIKPHNILLDENFTPKVSDFGLAKLYATNNSIKSLTEARGTIGYMAPELFYRNIGNVSYKADIYSYGMLLLEISGKRKKLNELEENSSESSYFPSWVYDEVCNGNVATDSEENAEENRIAKQMVVVGLWCIQMKPCDRPSMNKVIEMLEAGLESLELPPKPVLYPDEIETKDGPEFSSVSDAYSESSCLIESSCSVASL